MIHNLLQPAASFSTGGSVSGAVFLLQCSRASTRESLQDIRSWRLGWSRGLTHYTGVVWLLHRLHRLDASPTLLLSAREPCREQRVGRGLSRELPARGPSPTAFWQLAQDMWTRGRELASGTTEYASKIDSPESALYRVFPMIPWVVWIVHSQTSWKCALGNRGRLRSAPRTRSIATENRCSEITRWAEKVLLHQRMRCLRG